MSKKYKRQLRRETAAPATAITTTIAASRTPSISLPVFNPNYTYVIKNLRRIGLLAGSFITILMILSFCGNDGGLHPGSI